MSFVRLILKITVIFHENQRLESKITKYHGFSGTFLCKYSLFGTIFLFADSRVFLNGPNLKSILGGST
jgi:hypothetical protein